MKIPDDISGFVEHSSEQPKALCKRLAEMGSKRIYVDGGVTIQKFLSEGLITDMTITIMPIILGAGIPLFGSLNENVIVKHISTKSYNFGAVQSHYEIC